MIRDMGDTSGSSNVVKHLNRGRRAILHEHANSIGELIGSWYTFSPALTASKATRGFPHPDCGRLLCPAMYNWDDMS